VYIDYMDVNKTRNQNIRDYIGYSIKTKYAAVPGWLMKDFILLMSSNLHGASYGLTFTFNRDNDFLKPRLRSLEQYLIKSMQDREGKYKSPPKAYTTALRSHRKVRRNSNPDGRMFLMCPS
jgi:hypothetical protein